MLHFGLLTLFEPKTCSELLAALTKRQSIYFIKPLWPGTDFFVCLFVCVEVLRSCQQLQSCQAGQLPINTVPGQA